MPPEACLPLRPLSLCDLFRAGCRKRRLLLFFLELEATHGSAHRSNDCRCRWSTEWQKEQAQRRKAHRAHRRYDHVLRACQRGVRTYLEAKHRHLWHYPGIRHSVLVPGASYRQANGIHEVPAPPLPFGNGYRFPLRRGPWRRCCAICNRT